MKKVKSKTLGSALGEAMAKKKRGRGRPSFVPTQLNRQRVERYISCGMQQDEVAKALDIDVNTLKKHFPDELRLGKAKKRGEVLDMLYEAAEGGNVSAQRKLVSLTHGGDLGDENMKFSSTKKEDAVIEPKKGKKELVQEEADNIKGKYEPPSPPKLVIDNSRKK